MKTLREIALILCKAALGTVMVVLAFIAGDSLRLPLPLQAFFFLPVVVVLYRFVGGSRPSSAHLMIHACCVSLFVLLFMSVRHMVPEQYLWVVIIAFAMFFPSGSITRWLERHVAHEKD
ncbi:MAG: hypothetical protein H7A50_16895 [Akkermansiaceae bacterium]|nr:hypothetical protein [Akkermansiaceae bacterium]